MNPTMNVVANDILGLLVTPAASELRYSNDNCCSDSYY